MAGFMGWLPFGQSNVNNGGMNVPNPGQPNPNFPSKNQLDPKNNSTDPAKSGTNNGNNEPNPDPNNNADPTKGNQGSQLDQFKELFTIQTDDKGNPVAPHQDPLATPLLRPDAAKLKEVASKMNFTSGLDQETLQKAMSGQDPQAFMQVLNQVAQNGFLTAMQANAGVMETAFSQHTNRIETALPDRIRNFQIKNAAPKNPVLNHPAAAPVVEGLKSQIAAKNPHLSPEKVAEHAENYFIAMMADMNNVGGNGNNGGSGGTGNPNGKQVDWMALLGS